MTRSGWVIACRWSESRRKCNSIPSNGVYSGVVLLGRIGGRDASPRNPSMHFGKPIEFRAVSRLACAADCLTGALSLTLVACALLLPVRAQTGDTLQVWSSPGLPSNPARSEKYTVSGTVVNAVTSEPVRKALVQLYGMQQRAMFSDADGRFQFDGILAGQVSLSAQKPGYFGDQEIRQQGQLQVEVGPKSDSVVLKLTPQAVIAGKVTDATGIPLEHVSLSLTYLNVREGRRHWEPKGIANTAEDGRFRFPNLPPGTYYLSTTPFTPRPETLFDFQPESKTGYPGAYYPGVPDLNSASPISLSAGQQAEANFTLSEVPAYNISGTISGYAPGEYTSVQLCDQSGSPLPFSYQFSPDNGRIDFHGVPAGVYVLKAFSGSASKQPIRGEMRINVSANTYNVRLALSPWPSITVSVRTEPVTQSAPSAKNYVRPASQGPPLGVRLLPSQPGTTESYPTLEGPPGQQTPAFSNVEPGRYSIELMPQDPWYVQSAEYGQTNLLTDDLTILADAPPATIKVVLRNDVAMLAGTVSPHSGVPVPATVIAIPERVPKASPKLGYYNPPADKSAEPADGFMINSLAPGDYLVFAFDHAEAVEYANPDVLQNYISQATHVTLVPGQTAHVKLDLIRTGESSN